MTTQTNLTKLTKANLIAMVAELRAENAELRASKEALCDEVVDLMAQCQELSEELRDASEQPAPQQPAPQPQPQRRRQPRDLTKLREAAMAHGAVAKFDDAGNIVVLVRGAWVLA